MTGGEWKSNLFDWKGTVLVVNNEWILWFC